MHDFIIEIACGLCYGTMHEVQRLPSGVTFLRHGWMSANCVLIHGEQTVLIDAGHINGLARTLENLRAIGGRTPADIDAVWLTHPHSDHAGGTATFQEAGAEVWAHPITAARVNAWDERAMWVSYADQLHRRFTVTRTIAEDEPVTLNGLTLVPHHAPGHASGMIAIHCPERRFLITADALWEDGFGPLAPDIEGEDAIDQQRETLHRLAALDVDVVLPGHGPTFTGFAAACERAQGRLDAYARDPARVARSRLRAYFVHRLLEVDGMPEAAAPAYLERVPCYAETRARYASDGEPDVYWGAFLADMLAKGMLRRMDGRVYANTLPDADARVRPEPGESVG